MSPPFFKRRAALVILLGALGWGGLGGCGAAPAETVRVNLCSNDNQCQADEVCFADGCGRPDEDVRIEVTPNASMGRFPQDFVVGKLGATQDFSLYESSLITGGVYRESLNRPGELLPTQLDFTLRAEGMSELIPGLVRRYEASVSSNGVYSLATGFGRYHVTVSPKDLPPLQFDAVSVGPHSQNVLDVVIPAQEKLVRLDGRLVLENQTLLSHAYDIQALHPSTFQPLSARTQVSQSLGDFQLFLAPDQVMPSELVLRASPRDPRVLAPTKDFHIPSSGIAQALEMGHPGEVLPISGTLLTLEGQPLAGATVHVSGETRGGGRFETLRATTDASGRFALESFPGTMLTFHATPPVESTSGLLQQEVAILNAGELGTFGCPNRVEVLGLLQRPDSPGGSDSGAAEENAPLSPAVGATVIATPIGAMGELPLPSGSVEGRTDAQGRYSLRLDAAVWRLDFLPGEALPRISRIITVLPSNGVEPMVVESFQLSRGRTVTGTVKEPQVQTVGANLAASNAAVKLYRVVDIDGETQALLVSQTVTDENGNYSLVLPTR